MTGGDSRGLFHQQLRELRDSIVYLSDLTMNAIGNAIHALKERDVELAQQIIDSDEAINNKRYEIEEQCITLIATQQPAASDLRAIIAAIHIAVELERMGDYASGIAELAARLADQPSLKPLIDVPRMAEINQEMIRAALGAYLDEDAELAIATARRDAEIDQLYDQIYRELLTYMLEDPKTITRATYLLWITHNLERIADRVTNICERVLFITTAELKELNY
jgi:phosphate transport system protein